MGIDLSEGGRALLEAITEGATEVPTRRRRRRPKTVRRAWSFVGKLEGDGHSAEAIAALEAAELVERWDRKDGQAVTLTPWGQAIQDVVLLERPTVVREEEAGRDKDGKRIRVMVEREDVEVYWGREDPTRPRPQRLPYRRRQFSMPCPELQPDPAPGPEYLLDDEGEPVQLFAALFTGTGFPIEIDYRLGGAKTKRGKGKAAPAPAVNLHGRPRRGFTPEELGLGKRKRTGSG